MHRTIHHPYGMVMPGRHYSDNDGYRYGFNGKEMVDEVSGDGNIYDYGFRIYNPRLAKFLSVDPLSPAYPWYTPYQFAGNMPIIAIDLDGLEEYLIVSYRKSDNLRGFAIKRLSIPTANTVKLKALEAEKQTVAKDKTLYIQAYDADTDGQLGISKKKYKNQIALFDDALREIGGDILIEKQNVAEENKKIQEANKGKAVYLEIENSSVMSVDDVLTTTDNIKPSEYSASEVVELSDGTKKLLANSNGSKKVDRFNSGKARVYGQYMPMSFKGDALFNTSSYEISAKGKTDLMSTAQTLIANPGTKIEIIGNTDNAGSEVDNVQLSKNRATAVKDYLISQGVSPNQIISVSGVGSTNPIGDNATPEGRSANRRVDINQIN